jgi:hypothetical protein
MYIKLFKRDHFGHGFSNSPFQDAALDDIGFEIVFNITDVLLDTKAIVVNF